MATPFQIAVDCVDAEAGGSLMGATDPEGNEFRVA